MVAAASIRLRILKGDKNLTEGRVKFQSCSGLDPFEDTES